MSNNISSNQELNTFTSVLASGVLASYLFAAGTVVGNENSPVYITEETNTTFNAIVSIERGYTPEEFEQKIGGFYARLLESQQPLGAEFEKVLHENLSDLYES